MLGNAAMTRPLHNVSLADLHADMTACDIAMAHAKERKAVINDELEARFRTSVDYAFRDRGKAFGTVKITIADPAFKIEAEIEKKVSWDSDELLACMADMDWVQIQAIFKIDLSIPEKTWDGIQKANPAMAQKFAPARTVKYTPKPPKLIPVEEGK